MAIASHDPRFSSILKTARQSPTSVLDGGLSGVNGIHGSSEYGMSTLHIHG